MLRYTKEKLYKEVNDLRIRIGIDYSEYPVRTVDRCLINPVYTIDIAPLRTNGLQGVLIADRGTRHIILNSARTIEERNFFCMHEVIHGYFHVGLGSGTFNCFEKVRENQNSFFEWHANEGAAEFLVPHKQFIPKLLDCWNPTKLQPVPFGVRKKLADEFFVSDRVIYNRIESLKYEIMQVHRGAKINDIALLSANQQRNLGICVRSLNESVCTTCADCFLEKIEDF
jgi:Zn-dependent peptidase ImmA (M78 family)